MCLNSLIWCWGVDCYDNNESDIEDVVGISIGTTKQVELFDYVGAPNYLKSRIKDYDDYDNYKENLEIIL